VKYPSLGKSILPIIIPILLIILGSIAAYPTKPFGDNVLTTVFLFIGNPVIALLFGVFLSFTLPEKFDRKLLSSTGWVGEAVVISAPIILITGAGGAFGSMLQNSGLGDLVSRVGDIPSLHHGLGIEDGTGIIDGSHDHNGIGNGSPYGLAWSRL
jgi:GntP family gluconate:H+ symporter